MDESSIPLQLKEIPEPPKRLYLRGKLPSDDVRFLSVVGSRKYTPYGKEACEHLVGGLRGYPVSIVSGLALGIDSIAHEAALDAGLHTIAIPGSGLRDEVLYPRTHVSLAHRIIESGGALLSEFEPDFKATDWGFPKRNRIMAGIAHAVLVIEAQMQSGTRITARLAMDYNRDVLAVPGSIFSSSSEGTNQLIRDGATPITKQEELIDALGFKAEEKKDILLSLTHEEEKIMEILADPLSRGELLRKMDMPTHEANVLLSAMEVKGLITETMGEMRKK
jgi:DNA processing protein